MVWGRDLTITVRYYACAYCEAGILRRSGASRRARILQAGIFLEGRQRQSVGGLSKRLVGLAGASVLLVLLAPIMLVVGLVRFVMGGRAIFAHKCFGFAT